MKSEKKNNNSKIYQSKKIAIKSKGGWNHKK
jgi:hypothetical protein